MCTYTPVTIVLRLCSFLIKHSVNYVLHMVDVLTWRFRASPGIIVPPGHMKDTWRGGQVYNNVKEGFREGGHGDFKDESPTT